MINECSEERGQVVVSDKILKEGAWKSMCLNNSVYTGERAE